MSKTTYLFIGPYAEWFIPESPHFLEPGQEELDPEDRDPSRPDLVEDGRLFWNISYGSGRPPLVEREGRTLFRYCCSPLQPRPGAGRSPMLLRFGEWFREPDRLEFAVVDLLRVDREAEVRWFREAFAEELRELESRVFGTPPQLGWGLVGMWS